ncbi:glycosyltransferase family 2 protein [Stomatohabitans albus]|uniref:glycosyltransferase family 2 protein n=1 Tax=Stomatohabitans albus TaxID=3110766 RepID=UPI00300C192A
MSTVRTSLALPATPHVLVVMVATGRPNHIVSSIRTLRAQTYPMMDVVAVDDTGLSDVYDALSTRLGDDRVLRPDRRVGFARAANMALRDPMVANTGMKDADIVIFMRSDVALSPDAIAWMVRHLQQHPDIAIVGPKIRAWSEAPILRSFGMSADFFAHAEGGVETGELDQGQYDDRGEALWVDGACLAVRTDVWKTIGGFDTRYDHHREDFDLCWRARILGNQVGLVHEAVAYAADRDEDPVHTRYLQTRNTITTRWKNMSTGRLIVAQLLSVVLGLATLLWLVLTRRFGQAWAVIRAWAWAVGQLGGTTRRRHTIQRLRTKPERAMDSLRVGGLPRANRVVLAFIETFIHEDDAANDESWSLTDPLADQPFQRFLRDQSLIIIGLPMLIALIFSTATFWNDGAISGGQIAPWVNGHDWINGLLSGQPLSPIGDGGPSSPTAWALASLAWVLPLPTWLVQRITLFALPVVAWIGTMFLGRYLTGRPAPRVFAAAAVASSPLLVNAIGSGDLDGALILALTPGLASATLGLSTVGQPAKAWRATAYWAFIAAIMVGADPRAALWVMVPLLIIAIGRSLRPASRMGLVRMVSAVILGVSLVAPWLAKWGPTMGWLDSFQQPMWDDTNFLAAITGHIGQTLTLAAPDPIALIKLALSVLVPAIAAVAMFTIGVRRNALVAGLSGLAVVLGAFGVFNMTKAAIGQDWGVGAGGLWLIGIALLVVLTVTWSTWEEGTRTRTSAWGMLLSTFLVAGIGYQGFELANGPWNGLHVDPLAPAFVSSETLQVGAQRTIRLGRDAQGRLEWAATWADGPRMNAYGQFDDPTLVQAIDEALPSAVRQIGSNAGNVLGLLGVRWIVLDGADEGLTSALSAQPWLDRVPSTAAVVYRVATWQPFVSIPSSELAATIRAGGALPPLTEAETPQVLRPTRTANGWTMPVPAGAGDLVILALGHGSQWEARADGTVLQPVNANGNALELVHAWTLPPNTRSVQITAVRAPLDQGLIMLQGIVLLIILSLALRPPGRRTSTAIDDGDLPDDLTEITDSTGPIPVVTTTPTPGGQS